MSSNVGFTGGRPVVDFRPSGDQGWAQQAACAEDGIAPMFPHEHDVKGIAAAKSICDRCPVRGSCLAEALDRGEPFGIWGGTTVAERRVMRRGAARKAAKAARPKAMTARVSADGKRLVGMPVTDLDTGGLT